MSRLPASTSAGFRKRTCLEPVSRGLAGGLLQGVTIGGPSNGRKSQPRPGSRKSRAPSCRRIAGIRSSTGAISGDEDMVIMPRMNRSRPAGWNQAPGCGAVIRPLPTNAAGFPATRPGYESWRSRRASTTRSRPGASRSSCPWCPAPPSGRWRSTPRFSPE